MSWIRGLLKRIIRKTIKHHEKPALEDGRAIFQELRDIYGKSIDDFDAIDKFFKDLMRETNGWVIVDFLDTDNWDCIRDVQIDKEKGVLKLYWQLPAKDPVGEQMRKMVFSTDYYLMILKLKNVHLVSDSKKQCFAICVNGYTWPKNEYKKYVVENGWQVSQPDESSSFFSTDYLRLKDKTTEFVRILKTPIRSFWIIPKDLSISHTHSKKLLYLYNLQLCSNDLDKALTQAQKVLKKQLPKDDEDDEIKLMGNKMRQRAESLFKLMLCFYHEKCGFKAEDYNSTQRLLGVLISELKKTVYTNEIDKEKLNTIVRIANDLSHDSGTPVEESNLLELYSLLKYFIKDFKNTIQNSERWLVENNPNMKPSPKDYIQKEYNHFDFSKEIDQYVQAVAGKISFKIEVRCGSSCSFAHFEECEYLCKDGKIKKLNSSTINEALVVWDRSECKALVDSLYEHVRTTCDAQGLSTDGIAIHITFVPKLHREGNPVHLFTENEIKALMKNADDSVSNKLVIDEDGYAQVIQDIQDGSLYPVSQETWGAGNGYVGKQSALSDLHDSYVLCVHLWLSYLKSEGAMYGDLWMPDEDLSDVIEEIKTYQ